jgi:hypothetical protein
MIRNRTLCDYVETLASPRRATPKGDAEGRQNLHHLHSTASSSSTYINLILCARGAHDASQGFVLGPKRFSVGTDNFHEIDSFGLPCRSGSGKD